MIDTKLTQLPKKTVEIVISIPWADVKTTYDELLKRTVSDVELPGFRKGKAPRKMVEEKLDKTKLYEEVVKEIVPKAYAEAVKKENIKPFSSPKIEVLEAKEGVVWKIKATVALKPVVNLKNYKEDIKKLKTQKPPKIWVPGDDKDKKEEIQKTSIDDIIKTLLTSVEVDMSPVLIQDEANRLLANLLDQTQKLGMSVEQYLSAKGRTSEDLRAEYALEAKNNLTVELALSEIADSENITVSDEEIKALVDKVEKPEEKERLQSQSYYLAHLIRQQKTLDFLNNL